MECCVRLRRLQGEVKWCRWLNRIYQEECRKAALMRLRRIQDYVVKQRKVTAYMRSFHRQRLTMTAESCKNRLV